MRALRHDGPSWFEEVRASDPRVTDVAARLGMGVQRGRFGPCPSCGKDDRRHPPLTVRGGGSGWMCAHCKSTGDAVRLVAWMRTGSPKPATGDEWAAVRQVFADAGWCAPGDAGSARAWTPPPRAPEPEPEYPPAPELMRLLAACRPIADVPEVRAWCDGRGFAPGIPAAVLPDVFPWPAWWPFRGRPWRLMVSAVDSRGSVRSLHARATEDTDRGKTRWPYGTKSRGLLFADPKVARPMLRGQPVTCRRLYVTEGITSYLALAGTVGPMDGVIGAANGGFGALAEARIPRSVQVAVATDEGDKDGTGDRYAAEVQVALREHDVRRIRFSKLMVQNEQD